MQKMLFYRNYTTSRVDFYCEFILVFQQIFNFVICDAAYNFNDYYLSFCSEKLVVN